MGRPPTLADRARPGGRWRPASLARSDQRRRRGRREGATSSRGRGGARGRPGRAAHPPGHDRRHRARGPGGAGRPSHPRRRRGRGGRLASTGSREVEGAVTALQEETSRPFQANESRKHLLGRDATTLLVLPLRAPGGDVEGMISVEADARRRGHPFVGEVAGCRPWRRARRTSGRRGEGPRRRGSAVPARARAPGRELRSSRTGGDHRLSGPRGPENQARAVTGAPAAFETLDRPPAEELQMAELSGRKGLHRA